jgi:hypothetical protein
VRGGISPFTYVATGTKRPNILEECCVPEHTFNGRSASKFGRRTGPNEEGLGAAVAQVHKSGRGNPC